MVAESETITKARKDDDLVQMGKERCKKARKRAYYALKMERKIKMLLRGIERKNGEQNCFRKRSSSLRAQALG